MLWGNVIPNLRK